MQLPWRRAPRAAFSGPLTVLVTMVAALVLSFVAAAAVLHTNSATGAAVSYQESRLCDQGLAPGLDQQQAEFTDVQPMVSAARVEGAKQGLDDVVTAAYSPLTGIEYNGVVPLARLGYRDGAYDNLKVVQGGGRDGLWVPRSFAETAHVKLGDRGLGGTLPPVTAIYEDVSEDTPEFWCTEREFVVVPVLAKDGVGPVIFTPSMQVLRTSIDEHTKVAATIRYRLTPLPGTVTEAQDVIVRAKHASGRVLSEFQNGYLSSTDSFTTPLRIAGQAEVKVRDSTLPLTVISLLVGLIGLAAVTVQWCQRRQAELRLLWTRGAGPLALGGRAVLELAVPLVLGSGLGLLLADLLRGWYAPAGALPDGTRLSAALLVGGVAVAGLIVIVVTASLRCRRVLDSGRRHRVGLHWLRFVPWELITAVLAYQSWQRMVPRPTGPPQGKVLIEADAAGLAFPLLVVLTTALVVARLARFALSASHRTRWRWAAGHLALRRLAAARGSAVGVLVVGILAVGTLTVGSGIAGAQQDGLNNKAGTLIGANSVTTVPKPVGLDPRHLPPGTTIVGIDDHPGRTLLVVDPATFPDAAALGDRTPADVAALLNPLQQGNSRYALPVNRSPAGAHVAVTYDDNLDTIGHATSFPFIGGRPGYVVTRAALSDLNEVPEWQVWSPKPLPELLTALDDARIAHSGERSAPTALDGLPFLTVTWTFTFVAALGLVLAVVAAVALVLAVEVRRRQNALSGALALRMGLSRRTLTASHALELGALAFLASTAGCATGLITTGVSLPLFDPAPWLRPVTATPHMLPLVAATYLATACVVGLVCWTAVRSVRGARLGELIRVTT